MATSVHIKQLVESSAILSDAERKEWLDLLPYMNDKQQSELLLILQPNPLPDSAGGRVVPPSLSPAQASQLPVPSQVSAFVPPVAPPTQPATPVNAVRPTQPAVATTVSAFLNKNFASELHRGSMPGTFKSASIPPSGDTQKMPSSLTQPPTNSEVITPVAPKLPEAVSGASIPVSATPKSSLPPFGMVQQQKNQPITGSSLVMSQPKDLPVAAAVQEPDLHVAPMPDEPMVHARSLEAVRMLNVTTLRGSGVMNVESELKVLCEKFGYFSVQFAFEQSPLYQAYVAVGARILKEHRTFEEVQAALAAAGRPYLTKPEFEEFSDLIRRLKAHP